MANASGPTALFQRRVVVLVDELRVDGGTGTGFRVEFKAKKDIKSEPNTLDLSITNLSENTRSQMKKKGSKVVVLAGYAERLSQVFSGSARTIDHVREDADWRTHVQCGDGEASYGKSKVSLSFGKGHSAIDVAKQLGMQLVKDGLGKGNLDQALSGLTRPRKGYSNFANGAVFHGKTSVHFEELIRTLGLTWSIQDGQLQLLGPTESTPNEAILVNQTSGLIGSPEYGSPPKDGQPSVLKVKMLLQPSLRPGAKFVLESQNIKRGVFRCEKVEHQGDTDGGDWYTNVEARPSA